MNTVSFDYRPLPVHHGFHRSTAYERSLFGGYGSGKSFALCADAISFGLAQPGSEILIARKTIPSLRDTTEAIFTAILPEALLAACDTRRMGGHYESITLPNGSKYMFRGLDDWTKLKSLSLAAIYYDEADEIDEDTYVGLMSRVRQRVPTPTARKLNAPEISRRTIVSASNPAGHNWLWKRFVSADAAPGTEWFKSTSLDNPFLPLTYIDSMLAMPKPWVRRYVLCDFDDFGGQIYGEWGWDSHVIEPYRQGYDAAGFFWMGMDPGTRDPTAGLWCYYDPNRHALVGVAEYQEHSLTAMTHAAAWRKIEARHRMKVRRRIADPHSINVRDRGTNNALSDQYRRLGFNFELGPTREHERIPALGQLIAQQRFLVTSDCPQSYEQILNYRWKDLTPQQRSLGLDAPAKPLKRNTHLVDCGQFVASRYIAPPKIEARVEDQRADWSQEVQRTIRQQISDRRNATSPHDLGNLPV